MNLFRKAAWLLLVHICIASYGQRDCSFSIAGRVVDHDNKPVAGAAVILSPQQTGQTSDLDGNFRFTGICPGRYKIKVQYIGHNDAELDVTMKGDTHRIIRLTEDVTQLNEVVVEHHDASHTEHATTYATLDERKLGELAGKSLGQSLREIPGVNTLQTGPGIFKPVIHGVHSQRVLMLNYGIRQEGQQWGAEHAPEIDPFIASDIVVIKDASAIKYGSDAMGGVVVINPPALPDKAQLGGTIQTVLQSNGRSAAFSGMLEGGIASRAGWGWRVQGTVKRTGDFETPGYSLTNTGIRELNFSAATGYHKEDRGFDIFFSRFQTEIGILKGSSVSSLGDLFEAMSRDVPHSTTGFSYNISEPRQEASHHLLKLNGHIETAGGEWRAQYGFQNNNRREFDVRIGGRSHIPAIDLRLNTHSFQVEWETHHSQTRTISAGVNGIYQLNKNIPGTQRIPFIPNFTNISAGVFAVAKFFRDTWTFDAGVRYDFRHYRVKGFDYKNTFYSTAIGFNNASATLAATKRLNAKQSVSLNLSSAWRPPHVVELYSLGTHQSAAAIEYGLLLNDATNEVMNIDDVDFKTEQALKLVAGYRLQSERVTFELNPYANYIFNYIYLRPVGITENVRGVYPYFRYDQTDALFLGTDVSAAWQLLKNVTLGGTASLLRASDESNNDYFIFIPANRYEASVRYERPAVGKVHHFYVESDVQFVSRQNRAPRVVTVAHISESQQQGLDPFGGNDANFDFKEAPEGYYLWNMASGFSIKNKKVQYDFRLACENTLNTRYREYTNRFRYYADETGRNITFSFKCIF